MRKPLFLVSAALLALFATLSPDSEARPDELARFLGTYETKGKYSNRRHTAAEITIVRGEDGSVSIRRTGRYTSQRHRRKPSFSWRSSDLQLSGEELQVTYRIATADGRSVRPADGGNLVDELLGSPDHVGEDGRPVDPEQVNVFTATYSFDEEGLLREEIQNTTRKEPEQWWKRLGTKGPQLSAPEAEIQRLKLGSELTVGGGEYPVVVPTDGTLTLTLDKGTLSLRGPGGSEVATVTTEVRRGLQLTLEVPFERPLLGSYTAVVAGVDSGDATLKARFVQGGRIDPRIRPWSSHTYYPIYEFGYGTSENDDTMFCTDGPLQKLDRVLGLSGTESAEWWERGTDYRTGFGFERGHYTKKQSPQEKAAESEWYADLDGDGVIEGEDAGAVLKRYDADGDGRISGGEAAERFTEGAVRALWATYDANHDQSVDAGEIFESFITRYDSDGSKGVDYTEWGVALRKAYAHVLEKRSKPRREAFLAKDADGDGFVNPAELGTPGALDFQDSSDVDQDYENFFDRNNIALETHASITSVTSQTYYGERIEAREDATVALLISQTVVVALPAAEVQSRAEPETHYGNKLEEADGTLTLYKGRKQDQLVVELPAEAVARRRAGIADGDLNDSYSVGWWGHCNAWALASIVFRKPAGELEVAHVDSGSTTFSVRDLKGLLVEFGMRDTEDSTFWWKQDGNEEIDPKAYAAGFYAQMHRWLRVQQQGMMADMDLKDPNNNLGFQVWNYPLLGYELELEEAEGDDPWVLDGTYAIQKGSYSDEDSEGTARVKVRLEFGRDGRPSTADESRTAWMQTNSSDAHEYIRYLIHPYRFTSAGSGNPNVTQERLEKVFGELKYNRLQDLEAEDAATGGLSGTEPEAD